MLRRDFLKAFSAFGAAIAAGVKMPSGREVAAAPLPPPPTPPTLKPQTLTYSGQTMQDMVMERLKECDVVHYSRVFSVGGHDRWTVTYRYIEGQTPSAYNLNSSIEPLVAGKRPVSVMVSSHVDSVDITDLDIIPWRPPVTAVVDIEVTWA
jgi:hypothetical protein